MATLTNDSLSSSLSATQSKKRVSSQQGTLELELDYYFSERVREKGFDKVAIGLIAYLKKSRNRFHWYRADYVHRRMQKGSGEVTRSSEPKFHDLDVIFAQAFQAIISKLRREVQVPQPTKQEQILILLDQQAHPVCSPEEVMPLLCQETSIEELAQLLAHYFNSKMSKVQPQVTMEELAAIFKDVEKPARSVSVSVALLNRKLRPYGCCITSTTAFYLSKLGGDKSSS